MLPNAKIEMQGVNGINEACQTDGRDHCTILIDTRDSDSVDLFVSQDGYEPIFKTVKVSGSQTTIPVELDFTPVYGTLRVEALSPTKAKCQGYCRNQWRSNRTDSIE